MNSSSSGKLKIPTLKLHKRSLENRKTEQLESEKSKQMETNGRQKLEAVRALQIAAENKCVEFDFELQERARGAFVEADLHAFFFFSFFFWLYIWAFFLFPFSFQFCSFKCLAIFLECTLFFFPKISDFFLVATVRKKFRRGKKKARLYRSKKAVIKLKWLLRFSIARIGPKFKKKRQTFIHISMIKKVAKNIEEFLNFFAFIFSL